MIREYGWLVSLKYDKEYGRGYGISLSDDGPYMIRRALLPA